MSTTTPSNNGAATTAAPTFTEAPASMNVRVISPGGFDYLLTMRGARVGEVLNQAAQLESWLLKHNWQPVRNGNGHTPAQASPNGNGQAATAVGFVPTCAIHKTEMVKRQGKNGAFWSCGTKLDDGSWCPYRPPKDGQR